MPENKSDGEANSTADPAPDKDVDDNSEFVEVDPTGRYGRVSTFILFLPVFLFRIICCYLLQVVGST